MTHSAPAEPFKETSGTTTSGNHNNDADQPEPDTRVETYIDAPDRNLRNKEARK